MGYRELHRLLLGALVAGHLIFSGCAEFEDIFNGSVSSEQAPRTNHPLKSHSPYSSKKEKHESPAAETGTVERFIWPVNGRVTSPFGARHGRPHDGIDIASPKGTPVKAASNGEVIYTGRISGYGNLVIIKHAGNYFTAYAHLSQTHVAKGERVRQGRIIGNVGRTGHTTGAHLHFEIRYKAIPKNPMDFLP